MSNPSLTCCSHCMSLYTWGKVSRAAPCISEFSMYMLNKPDLFGLPDKPPCNRGSIPGHVPMVLQRLPEMRNVLVATKRLLLLYISRAICTVTLCSQSHCQSIDESTFLVFMSHQGSQQTITGKTLCSEGMPRCEHVTAGTCCQAHAVMHDFYTTVGFNKRS